jgi:hypothetical protein
LADIWVNILGDATKLEGALEKASGHVSSFSEKIGSIGKIATIAGTAITGIFTAIVLKTAQVGDQFNDMSLRTGVSVEHLSTLAYAAELSGTNIEGLEIGLKFLTKGMDDASKGIGTAKDAFEYLGISVVDAEGNLRPTIDVLKEAATKIAEIENPAKQAALAMDLFGARSGTQLIPLLKEGGAGIEELMGKAKDLGIEISTKSAQAADEFKDKMTSLTGSLAGAGRTIGEVLIPAIIPLIEKATEIVGKISLWAEENPRLIETITKVGAVVGIVAAVGGPILMAVAAFGKISGAISAIGTISTGPIGLLILAIGAVVLIWKNWDTIVTFVEDWYEKIIGFLTDLKDSAILKVQEMIDWIVQKFEDLANLPKKMLDWGKNAVSGLADGIKSKVGDIGEACKSVGNKVKNFFGFESPPIEGPLSTSDQWMPNMMTMFGDGIYNNMDLVLEPLKYTGEKIEENIDDTTSAIGDLISDLKTSMQSGLSSAFYNILSGSKTFGEAMKDLWKSIIDAILQQIAKLAASWVIKLVFGAIGFDMGGIVKEFQSGGEVKKFQFGGMTDTVMAKLDIGEYVISKPMTDFIRRFKAIPQDLISAIAGGLPTPIPAFAGGGSVGTPNITASSFGETKIYIDIHDNRIDSEVDIKRLAVTISDEVLRKIELKRRH